MVTHGQATPRRLLEVTLDVLDDQISFGPQLVNSADMPELCARARARLAEPSAADPEFDAMRRQLEEFAEKEFHEWRQRLGKAEASAGNPAKPKSKRQRQSKKDVEQKVLAAIMYKIRDPDLNQRKCAQKAGLSPSTLHGRKEWQDWLPKIEQAHTSHNMERVKKAFDARVGESLPVDPTSERDPDTDNRHS